MGVATYAWRDGCGERHGDVTRILEAIPEGEARAREELRVLAGSGRGKRCRRRRWCMRRTCAWGETSGGIGTGGVISLQQRRVALKIIKLGMDTKSVIARFEAERQALVRGGIYHSVLRREPAEHEGAIEAVHHGLSGGAEGDRFWDCEGDESTADGEEVRPQPTFGCGRPLYRKRCRVAGW